MTFVLIAICIFLVLVALICNLHDRAVPPSLHLTDSKFNRTVLQQCPMFLSSYIPTYIWGKSGHIQTIIYGKMGRVNSPMPRGQRHFEVLSDGATMSYDVFEATIQHPYQPECTLLVCPGIANSSESIYIRTYVQYAQDSGYRVAVLNHLGALKNIPLTAPRIFTYGGTEEYGVMVDKLMKQYASSLFIAVGFSMGGNIITKFLGEHAQIQKKFIGAVSCCQGYDVNEMTPFLKSWRGLRKLYVMAMTLHHKGLLRRHSDILFGSQACQRYGQFDEEKIFSAKILLDVDVNYSSKRAGFKTCDEYYQWCSSRHFMDQIHIPFLFINSLDDPLVPPELLYIPRDFALKRDNVISLVTPHGGHLGFFEGGSVIPNDITWLDRVVVEFCSSLLHINGQVCDNSVPVSNERYSSIESRDPPAVDARLVNNDTRDAVERSTMSSALKSTSLELHFNPHSLLNININGDQAGTASIPLVAL